ncbi:hypothetical protein D9V37_07555 [Nocardioides mangrovicus]|uniref:DUF4430 domain-containing protein n=1 Tax=Nocardioides mangrovicus TaxID=2478913 RepID=A0A3L8P3D3_9ACTN|nr:hypothetical protein [Nocardioides mangrovicus]RLV49755.1 hypothetical protein D9V37_07555 [Nocardioides mangrovicus]
MTRLLVAIAALLVLGAAPAGAAPSSAGACTAGGVTVVVDFHQLGGGVRQSCDTAGGGRYADDIFRDVGVSLSYASRQPGFVCRVENAPQSDPCTTTSPADAYWGLFWNDGQGGGWTYSTSGVRGLQVPAGGSVAFAWQGSTNANPPGVAPTQVKATSAAKPTRAPTSKSTTKSKPKTKTTASATPRAASTATVAASTATTSAPTPTPTPTPTAATPAAATPSPTATPSATSSAQALSPAAATTDDSQQTGGGTLPWWLPVIVVVLLAGGGLGAVVWRRRGV